MTNMPGTSWSMEMPGECWSRPFYGHGLRSEMSRWHGRGLRDHPVRQWHCDVQPGDDLNAVLHVLQREHGLVQLKILLLSFGHQFF